MTTDAGLAGAIAQAFDGILHSLELARCGDDRFLAPPDPTTMFRHIFGGHLLALAVVGAGSTVDDKPVSSVHAAFVTSGDPTLPVHVTVDRVKDGRSMATRSVTLSQRERPLLVATVSFHHNEDTPAVASPAPATAAPNDTPLLQDHPGILGTGWSQQPPPVEIRAVEPPRFLGGNGTDAQRSHWMRLPHQSAAFAATPLLHAALLAFASDYFMLDMAFRIHPTKLGASQLNGLSLDHAIWFHRPPDFNQWHLHTQEAITLVGNRGLVRGSIHHDDHLVATVMQEVLMRPPLTQ